MRGLDDPPRDPADALIECIHAFEPGYKAPDDIESLQKIYLSKLDRKRALIVLDNVASDTQIQPLHPPDGCALLVTSRRVLTIPGATLGVLPPKDARSLLREVASSLAGQLPPRSDEEIERAPDLFDEICALCGRLPLALRAAGSLLQTTPGLKPGEYASQLCDVRQRIGSLEATDAGISVRATFSLSYRRLPEQSQRIFRQLAVFSAPFDSDDAAAIVQSADIASLRELVTHNMLIYDAVNDAFRLHDLVRAFADEQMIANEHRDAFERHTAYFIQVASAAESLYLQGNQGVLQGLALFDRIRAHIESVFQHLDASGNAKGLVVLVGTVAHTSDLRFKRSQRIRWLKAQADAACALGDRRGEGSDLGNLGLAYADLGEPRKAIEFYQQALAISKEIEARQSEASVLRSLADAYLDLGDDEAVAVAYDEAVGLYEALELPNDVASVLTSKANIYERRRDYTSALGLYDRVIELSPNNPMWYRNRACACIKLKDGERANADLNQAEHLQADHPFLILRRGEVYTLHKEYERAASCFERFIAERPELNTGYAALAHALFGLRQPEQALAQLEVALAHTDKPQDVRDEIEELAALHEADEGIEGIELAIARLNVWLSQRGTKGRGHRLTP